MGKITENIFPSDQWDHADPEDVGIHADKLALAMRMMDDYCDEQGNTQAVVIRRGAMIWHGTDIDNLHAIWSCTKSFASIVFGLLWDDGKVDPETYAKDIWPDLAEHYPELQLQHIGFFGSGYKCKPGEHTQIQEPNYGIMEKYHYSSEPDLLMHLLTMVADEPLQELFRRRIAHPIGLKDEEWDWLKWENTDGHPVNGGSGYPMASMQITARGMARVGWLMANLGNWNGNQLISHRYIDFATTNHWHYPERGLFNEDGWYKAVRNCYGFLWWLNRRRDGDQLMWPHLPESSFAFQGNRNNICFVIPEWDMCIVRLGTDEIINTDLFDCSFNAISNGFLKEEVVSTEKVEGINDLIAAQEKK